VRHIVVFLHHAVPLVAFHDVFGGLDRVVGDDREAPRILADALVLVPRQLDGLLATRVTALAQKADQPFIIRL
jgi:hypothetical protein